jgi:hypothetical protein
MNRWNELVTIEPDLYVVIREMRDERSPQPRPLSNGFSKNVAYRVIGLHSASETSEAYLIMVNDREELWFISNRHVRAHGIFPAIKSFRFSVENKLPDRELMHAPNEVSH